MRSYDVARREQRGEPVTFELTYVDEAGERKAEQFSCHGELSTLMLGEIARHADLEVASPEAMALLADFWLDAFGDDREYQRFLRFTRRHQVPDGILMAVMADLVEDFSARPTERPGSSPAGPSRSGPTSRADSPFTVIEGFRDLEAYSA